MQWLRRWAYSASGFNKLGLWHDDCLYEDEEVKEAVRRLPERLQDDRTFRITRAMQLSLSHQLLPKDQWTTYDEVGAPPPHPKPPPPSAAAAVSFGVAGAR